MPNWYTCNCKLQEGTYVLGAPDIAGDDNDDNQTRPREDTQKTQNTQKLDAGM